MSRSKTGGNPGKASARRLWLLRAGAWLLLAGLVVGAGVGLRVAIGQLFYRGNERFLLRAIVVGSEDDRPVDRAAILGKLDVVVGRTNLLAIDVGEVRRRILADPVYETVAVRRILPGTLDIQVRLRVPVARVPVARPGAGDGSAIGEMLVDEDGRVLPADLKHAQMALPQILGSKAALRAVPGDRLDDDPMLLEALRFLRLKSTAPNGAWLDVRRIVLDEQHRYLRVYLRENETMRVLEGAEVTVPTMDMAAAVDRALRIVEERAKSGQSTNSLNVTSVRSHHDGAPE